MKAHRDTEAGLVGPKLSVIIRVLYRSTRLFDTLRTAVSRGDKVESGAVARSNERDWVGRTLSNNSSLRV